MKSTCRPRFVDTGGGFFRLVWIFILLRFGESIILNGSPNSYARYPKWAHSFENSLSMEIKTRQSDGILLYTDDGGTHGNFYSLTIVNGFLQLDFRLGDNSNEFGQRRPIYTIRVGEVRIDDDKWHTLTVFQSWENVKLELDFTLVFKILNQRSFVFGNMLKNSDVFIGGLPPNMHMLPVMSSPLRRYSRHLAVNVRNLMYRQYPQAKIDIINDRVTSPQLIESTGSRTNEDDHCRTKTMSSRELFSCQNDGICYSTNEGAQCDCSLSDHDGQHCDVEKSDGELTFGGDEWVGYDVSSNTSATLTALRENITLSFKTVHGTSMLFFAGDEKSFIHLMIQDGAIIATSKFEGSDARLIRMFNAFPSQRYDDDSWHDVILERSLQMMTLIVDGKRDEIRQYAPEVEAITNTFAYVGSIPKTNAVKDVNRISFRGCMKKVRYDIDAVRILFVNLADQSYGGSVVKTGGDVSYSCQNPAQKSDVLSFIGTSSSAYLELPKWNSLSSGSLSFHFRSDTPDGLILYHGVMQHNATDYIAFELIDSHLYLIINLGSGVVRLQTTANKVSNGEWHHVQLDRLSRAGSVVVDAIKIDFNTPGVSSNLIIDDPIYIGNVPNSSIIYPASIWSIALQKGFVGCIKNIRINGMSAKIGQAFENTSRNLTGIEMGCPIASNELDVCDPNPCQNYAKCVPRSASFECDCSNTMFEGKRCDVEVQSVEMSGAVDDVHVMAHTKYSQVEHIIIRFKTSHSRGVLFDTGANGKKDRITVFLNDSLLNLFIQDAGSNNTFSWGKSLSDNHWHELQIRRLGQKLLLYLDGFWGHSIYLPNALTIVIDELGIGHSVHPSSPNPRDEHFSGHFSKFVFNGNDYLRSKRRANGKANSRENQKGQRNIKTSKSSSISFSNSTGFVSFSSEKIAQLTSTGAFRIQFKFQTLMRSALLLCTMPKHDYDQSFKLQIYNGRLKYTYRVAGQEMHEISPKLEYRQHLSDMRWHNVLIYKDAKSSEHIVLVDNTTMTLDVGKVQKLVVPRIAGKLYIGSNPMGLSRPSNSFRGCISSLRINEKTIDLFEDADNKLNVNRGCSGPVSRCVQGACANSGRCIQLWTSIRCDCSLTAHSGDRCQNPSTSVRFDDAPSMIFYEYLPNERPTTSKDYFVFSFSTTQPNGVLISIECAADQDYFTIFLNKGYLNVHYNLGSRDHKINYYTKPLNDGYSHVVKVSRIEANLTIQIDNLPSMRYRPKRPSDLVLLNMHTRISIGAAFNTRHLDSSSSTLRRRRRELFDSYQGEISGANVNGLMILDLYESGSNRVHSIGSPKTTAVSESDSRDKNDNDDENELAEIMMLMDENSNEALIESLAPSCLSLEEQQTCYIETTDDSSQGFFSPILPTATEPIVTTTSIKTTNSRRGDSVDEITALITSSLRSTPPTTTTRKGPTQFINPVRPTTPMGDIATTAATSTTNMQDPQNSEFPRTPLIMCSSLAVIIAIAAVVFFVFKCRQNPPHSEHYTMAMKSQSGYTAIAPELSPPMNHDRGNNDSCTQPLIAKPHINGNGYEPIKGSVITNGNGATLMRNGNGHGPPANNKKKDFKEWYV